ncbi:MAG: MarR family transcriptional regulator [Novosphingobium sp.]|nr:MarR family transcriptional regulator [Novosphingobium sp.]
MDAKEADSLTDLTADLMMVVGRMKRAAGAARKDGVHPGTEFSILDSIIRHGCRTVPEIATHRGVARQSVQEVVNRMVEAGSIALQDNPASKVSKILIVTDQGARFYEIVRANLAGRYQMATAPLRKGDIAAAARVLDLLAEVWLPEGLE